MSESTRFGFSSLSGDARRIQSDFAEMFEDGREKSEKFSQRFKTVAGENGCEFFDASTMIRSSDVDGVHFERDDHRALGKAVAEEVKRILG